MLVIGCKVCVLSSRQSVLCLRTAEWSKAWGQRWQLADTPVCPSRSRSHDLVSAMHAGSVCPQPPQQPRIHTPPTGGLVWLQTVSSSFVETWEGGMKYFVGNDWCTTGTKCRRRRHPSVLRNDGLARPVGWGWEESSYTAVNGCADRFGSGSL
jgi:hypothetical protein